MIKPVFIVAVLLLQSCRTWVGFALHSTKIDGNNLGEGSAIFTLKLEQKVTGRTKCTLSHDSVPGVNDSGYGYNKIGCSLEL